MPYAIDLGNTTLTVLFQHPETQKTHRLHRWVLATTGVELLTYQLQTWQKTLPLNAVINWASTNPQVEAHLFQHLETANIIRLNKHRLLDASTNGGVDFSYYQASWETMGIDRLLNALLYARKYPAETGILINAGTATTLDIIIKGKTYGGGAILAGVGAWQQALPQLALHLPLPLPLAGTFIPPTTTQEAITHGAGYPYAMGLLAYAQQLGRYWHASVGRVIVTGGYAHWLHQALKASVPLMLFDPLPTMILDEHWAEMAIFEGI